MACQPAPEASPRMRGGPVSDAAYELTFGVSGQTRRVRTRTPYRTYPNSGQLLRASGCAPAPAGNPGNPVASNGGEEHGTMRQCPLCLLGIVVVLGDCTGSPQTSVPAGTPIEPDVYDMTERWQVMFGLDGKLVVSNGRIDARAAPGDGPVTSSFDAQPTQMGWYAFTFARTDEFSQVFEVRMVRLQVHRDVSDRGPVIVTPESTNAAQALYVGPGANVKVKWQYNPGGEGIPGGWRLAGTAYSDAPTPPCVPGFEQRRGE